jgi:DNA-binding transcriptional LysR family regulator
MRHASRMELRHLQNFLAVAETLNYTRAAEKLNVSASPLSRSIQRLESEVGGPLFLRGTRRVELTPLGAALVPHARRVLDDVGELSRDMARRVTGHVEVLLGTRSVPPELTRAVLEDVIATAEPGAEVRLRPLDSFAQMEKIRTGELSLGLISRRSENSRLRYLPVLHEAPGIALPATERFTRLGVVHPEDLEGLDLLVQPGADPTAAELRPIIRRVRDVIAVDTDIVGGISAMITLGGSCCLTLANPTAPWHRYLAGAGVIVRPLIMDTLHAVTYLCWRTDRDRPDDLGPILAVARTRFAAPLDL